MQTRHNITLDKDIARELEVIAGELGEKKSTMIEKALKSFSLGFNNLLRTNWSEEY